MAQVLILVAHPDLRLSRVNLALVTAARDLAASRGDSIWVRDLYALCPDYVIDVEAEQGALERTDLIVWQHPFHWYAMPPLMKLWVDDVLALGWAYGRGANGARGALRGKDLWLVASTGGPSDAYRPGGYNRYVFDAFLPPLRADRRALRSAVSAAAHPARRPRREQGHVGAAHRHLPRTTNELSGVGGTAAAAGWRHP